MDMMMKIKEFILVFHILIYYKSIRIETLPCFLGQHQAKFAPHKISEYQCISCKN